MSDATTLTVLALNFSLKKSPAASSTDRLADEVLNELLKHGASGSTVRVVDHDIAPGVETDMGEGDEWPALRKKVLAADIVLFATPTWVGHASSVAYRVLERLDAELSETDDQGRPSLFDKVAIVAVVGNEDGAHKISADLFQALNDVGFTVPAQAATYWNGEAMQGKDYKDAGPTPEAVASATATVARNAAHLARALRARPYPAAE